MFARLSPLFTTACAALLLAALPAAAQVSLDASFDGDGRRTVSFDLDSAATDGARRIFPTAGGYLVVGQASNSPGLALALTKLNLSGQLDTSFGTNGKRSYAVNTPEVIDAVQDSQGRVVFAGNTAVSGGSDVLLGRLLPNGEVDPSFGFLGLARIDLNGEDSVLALAVGPQDQVIALVRARPDASFGWATHVTAMDANAQNQGSVFLSASPLLETGAAVWSTARDALLVGLPFTGPQSCLLAVYSVSLGAGPGGLSLDADPLGSSALAGTTNGCTQVGVSAIAALPGNGGALLAANRVNPNGAPGDARQVGLLLRIGSSGAVDFLRTEFAPFPTDDLRFRAVAVDAEGRLLVAADITNSSGPNSRFGLFRYLADGTPDTGFNTGSAHIGTSFNAGNGLDSPLASVRDLRNAGPRILLAGSSRWTGNTDDDFAIAAFTTPDAPLFANGFEP
ncbi:hypothetical protein [Aquimonas voraii]|uniref:Delta-60 repeat domain-containing protein n=1 Tax=Aquimonas voraii TaxID=265719 RepID=A0A1G6VNL8_9GAMM|nr:hypothetical protein [Aquimonas voraii]SDD54607.1 delta-60 repeat domain-containing protein [Aquimonas voraii]